ncbi:MAG TPA: GGDEF domain-containing protein [Desulfobulbus sp.]|nr:GGDEF domain-containing protein [Desulfobulbus sp.]
MVVTDSSGHEFLTIVQEKKLYAVFQPITCIKTQTIFGYEGLIRGPSDTAFQSPVLLFDTAAQMDMLVEFDFLCRETVIKQFQKLKLPGNLFINVDPVSIMNNGYGDHETRRIIRESGINPGLIVIEVTETRPIEDIELLTSAVTHYRNLGYQVALDDLGAGYSGLKLWSELGPDFVKIDRHFIHNVDTDKIKQQFIRSIIQASNGLGCRVITEGVETVEEYATLRNMGIQFAQGYYFSRPQTMPPAELPSTLFRKQIIRPQQINDSTTVEMLIKPAIVLQTTATVMEAGEIFVAMPDIESIVILHHGEPIGLLIRKDFMNIYASRYGKELFGRKSILRFVNRNILKVEKNQTLEYVSYKLTSFQNLHTEEFIITDNCKLAGTARLIHLLQAFTELKVNHARYANPLTMLPGNVPIQKYIEQLFDSNNSFVICYFDLDNFKPFNDFYGFCKGDEILMYLGEHLKKNTCDSNSFVGHIGGDDFVMVTSDKGWKDTVYRILEEFDANIQAFYEDGCQQITVSDRYGTTRTFPLMTLSVGAVLVENPASYNEIKIGEKAAIAKHKAKLIKGSSLYTYILPAPEE